MAIYDKKISVYDNIDCIEDAVNSDRDPDIDANDLGEIKLELSRIDDKIESIIVDLEAVDGLHTDEELTVKQMNDFFESVLPKVLEELEKIKERLY